MSNQGKVLIKGSRRRFTFVSALIFMVGGVTAESGTYRVGPQSSPNVEQEVIEQNDRAEDGEDRLSVLVPVMNPNIPRRYQEAGIWPELRRAEANRFSVKLKTSLDRTGQFNDVWVYPDSFSVANLYVMGKILESNGEDVAIGIAVIDISGKIHLLKDFEYKVKEHDIDIPGRQNTDGYQRIFDDIAEAIVKKIKKIKPENVASLDLLKQVRFGESLAPDYFSKYVTTSKSGEFRIVSAPVADDPMVVTLSEVLVSDRRFTDLLQKDYQEYVTKIERDYLSWQEEAFTDQTRTVKKKSKASAIFGKFMGVVDIASTAAGLASEGARRDLDALRTGANVAKQTKDILPGGTAQSDDFMPGAVPAAQEYYPDDGLNEWGQSLNIGLPDRYITLGDQQVELKGNVAEQVATWRQALKDYYADTAKPDTSAPFSP